MVKNRKEIEQAAPAAEEAAPDAGLAAPAVEAQRRREPVAYVGPTRLGKAHVTSGSVFRRGELPAHLKPGLADPEFASLFVPVSGLAQARAALRDPKSALARAFAAVARRKE